MFPAKTTPKQEGEMKKLAFLVSIIALLILTTISCLEGNPTITDIMADPEKWEVKEVTVD